MARRDRGFQLFQPNHRRLRYWKTVVVGSIPTVPLHSIMPQQGGVAMSHRRSLLLVEGILFLVLAVSTPCAAAEYPEISTDRLKAMIDAGEPFLLIDARTKEEYDEAHIVRAVSLPEKTFDSASPLLPRDKAGLIVIYCNGVKCGKSRKVAAKAAAAGFSALMLYSDGIPVWEERGFPIVAGPDYEKKVETKKLAPAEVKSLVDAGKDDYVLVDVRDAGEYAEGRIPAAVNIPVETFAARSGSLPKEKKIVVYCNSGGRSYNAYRKLMKLAYPDIFQTTFADWKEARLPIER